MYQVLLTVPGPWLFRMEWNQEDAIGIMQANAQMSPI